MAKTGNVVEAVGERVAEATTGDLEQACWGSAEETGQILVMEGDLRYLGIRHLLGSGGRPGQPVVQPPS